MYPVASNCGSPRATGLVVAPTNPTSPAQSFSPLYGHRWLFVFRENDALRSRYIDGVTVRRYRTYVSRSNVSFASPKSGSGDRPLTIGSHDVFGRQNVLNVTRSRSVTW